MDAQYFNTIAHAYDETIPAHIVQHYLNKRVRFLSNICSRGSALDVGCGTGTLAQAMTRACPALQVTGTDDSEGMLAEARKKGIATRKSSSLKLDYPDNAFDLVYCVAVMHHIGRPRAIRATVREMTRVCKPGGHVVIWDHNPWNPYWKPFMKRLLPDAHVQRLVPARELVAAFPNGTASRIHRLGWMPDFCPPVLVSSAQKLEKLLENTPGINLLSAHHVVVAHKEMRFEEMNPKKPCRCSHGLMDHERHKDQHKGVCTVPDCGCSGYKR